MSKETEGFAYSVRLGNGDYLEIGTVNEIPFDVWQTVMKSMPYKAQIVPRSYMDRA